MSTVKAVDLSVNINGRNILDSISFGIDDGEIVSLVGESGAGKTTICRTLLKLLPPDAAVETSELSAPAISRISMIHQEPGTALDPVMKIGKQVEEAYRAVGFDRRSAMVKSSETLGSVGLDSRVYKAYPHELSGGMKQRAVIATALAKTPLLLLADEPTSSLDGEAQAEIMKIFKLIRDELGTSILFISHDIDLARSIGDRMLVLKDGRLQPTDGEYAGKLIRYSNYSKGTEHTHGHTQAEIHRQTLDQTVGSVDENTEKPLVKVECISKSYIKDEPVLHDFSLGIKTGELVGLVGKSGIGKTTLAKCIAGLERADSGDILYNIDRHDVSMVFQDSKSAFDPKMRIEKIIKEPLDIRHKKITDDKMTELLLQVGLNDDFGNKYPYELSGGERQRVAIARALITEPRLLIADEPLSSLDVSIQAQIVHLLNNLREERDLAILLISHNEPMVEHVSDRVIRMLSPQVMTDKAK